MGAGQQFNRLAVESGLSFSHFSPRASLLSVPLSPELHSPLPPLATRLLDALCTAEPVGTVIAFLPLSGKPRQDWGCHRSVYALQQHFSQVRGQLSSVPASVIWTLIWGHPLPTHMPSGGQEVPSDRGTGGNKRYRGP